jgi:hypothetical protein
VLFAVAWVALWPLVTTAHALTGAEPMPLCHQAGMQVDIGEPVEDDPTLTRHPIRQHCPLCILVILAVGTAQVTVVAVDRIAPVDLARDFRDAIHPADLSARLPESRAPPSFLA